MSDQVVQPVSGQAAGTAPAPVSAQTQSREAVGAGQEQTSHDETQETRPVTVQDLQALKDELSKQIQSQVDKSNSRVAKELAKIDDAVKVLRASGREITDADVKTMKQNAAANAMIEPEAEPIAQQTADPLNVTQWPQDDPVTSAVIKMQLEHKLELTSAMPEAREVIRDKGAVAFVTSYEAALKKAAARLSAPPQATETKQPTAPAAARIPAGTNVPPAPNMTGRAYFKQAGKGG